MFKTYKRKIDVFCRNADGSFRYVWSTNAHPTCKSAVAAAKAKCPNETFKAHFVKETANHIAPYYPGAYLG